MTLNESSFRYQQLKQRIDEGLNLYLQIENSMLFQNRMSEILEDYSRVYSNPVYLNAVNNLEILLSRLQSDMLVSSFAQISDICGQISNTITQTQLNNIILSYEFSERLSSAIAASTSYISEDLQEKCDTIVPSVPQEKRETFLSFDRAIALLSFLISLYMLIVSQMPDPQLTQLAEQNDRLITIEEERLELERQQAEHLENIANNLGSVIIDLNEQIETQRQQSDILCDQIQDVDNLTDFPEQESETDSLQQDTDSEN